MENTNDITISDASKETLQFSAESAAYLLRAAKWGKFLAIMGFIFTGLLVIVGVLLSFVINKLPEESIPNMPFPAGVISVIYIVIAGIYIAPVIFLNSFCNNAIKAVNLGKTEHLTESIRNLKNLFVFVGIATIVILVLYTLILVIAGMAAVLSL